MAGLGEIGLPIYKLISKKTFTIGFDKNPKLINKNYVEKFTNITTLFLHVCIPFTNEFNNNIFSLNKKFEPQIIVIHSTIEPNTTEKLQEKLPVPIIYSATRGVHKRMIYDLKRYTKFFAISKSAPRLHWAVKEYSKLMQKVGIKTKQMSNPITLELAKIVCDTSYLGWLINYAQISNVIAQQHGVDYDEMWSFSDEIHKFLGNRPKMFPGYIGGHCVIPNLDLVHSETLQLIKKMNTNYLKKVKNAKSIYKKYT